MLDSPMQDKLESQIAQRPTPDELVKKGILSRESFLGVTLLALLINQ